MRKRWRTIAILAIVAASVTAAILLTAHQALRQVPDFYEQAVAVPSEDQIDAGYELERNVLGLHNDVRHDGPWSATFTQAQINGWLAVDLPAKFPDLLPASLVAPRVALTAGQMQVACRYSGSKLTTVVHLTLDIGLADEPNTLAIRIRKARAGLLPLPLKSFLDQISAAARRAELMLRWAQSGGDPVALITFDDQQPASAGQVVTLETIEIQVGRILLAGHTSDPGNTGDAGRSEPDPSTTRDHVPAK